MERGSQGGLDTRSLASAAVAELAALAPPDNGCWHLADGDNSQLTLCGLDCGPSAEYADQIEDGSLCVTCRDMRRTLQRSGVVP